jgi:chromosome segregation ATPase
MGRYYYGDINGKFWFGVQESTDAKHFGGKETLYKEKARYTFRKKDLPEVQRVIGEIQNDLGVYYEKLEEFFKEKGELQKHINVDEKKLGKIMELYARVNLGLKIEECIGTIGKCSFWADLW